MKAKVNLQLLNTTTFDSGSLGMMAMVIHQFTSPGNYQAVIMKEGHAISELALNVDEKSSEMQLNIDLAATSHKKGNYPCEKNKMTLPTVSPKGYVLFYATSGSAYSVKVATSNGDTAFDSTKLAEGDLFSVTLLEPGKYSMINKGRRSKGEIVVSLTQKNSKNIRNLETNYINVTKKGFNPSNTEVISSQGLVFRISDSSRIVIEKKEETKRKHKGAVFHIDRTKSSK